jgi:hypothetical protein
MDAVFDHLPNSVAPWIMRPIRSTIGAWQSPRCMTSRILECLHKSGPWVNRGNAVTGVGIHGHGENIDVAPRETQLKAGMIEVCRDMQIYSRARDPVRHAKSTFPGVHFCGLRWTAARLDLQ